ncbi:MAG: MFS transporter [Sorangiineae bacterium]|nr:MFS transporter [Polyangiaceae bacterium]MEB2322815.1 MFS transporter [Sorangiineae bacterium]
MATIERSRGEDAAPAGRALAEEAPAEPPVRRALVFSIVSLALLMMSVDGTIVATALDALERGLDTSINWAGWTVTAYSLGFVLMLPISGKLSERYGRRRVFLGSVLTFTLASLACGLAEDIATLIVLRALQAAGGAGFTPSATGIVVDHFGDARDRAVGLFGSIFPVGAMIGPIFGGLFVTYWTWRGVFFVNVPIGLVVILLGWRHIPSDRPRPRREAGGMDLRGLALLGGAVLGVMLAASALGEPGARALSLAVVAPALLAGSAGAGFFRHVRRAPAPFIEPRLIYGAGFGAVNLINAVFGGVTLAMITLLPIYATARYDIDALDSGTLLVAQGLAAIVFSLIAAFALRRTGYRPPILSGGVIIVAGALLLALGPHLGLTPFAWLAASASFIGMGNGTLNPASRNAGLQLAPDSSSTLAALRSMSMQMGSMLAVSVATALLAGSDDRGRAQAAFYVACAAVLALSLPLVRRVPEHRGAW